MHIFYLVLPPGSQEDAAWQRMRRLLRDNTAVVNSTKEAEDLDVHAYQEVGASAARPMLPASSKAGESQPQQHLQQQQQPSEGEGGAQAAAAAAAAAVEVPVETVAVEAEGETMPESLQEPLVESCGGSEVRLHLGGLAAMALGGGEEEEEEMKDQLLGAEGLTQVDGDEAAALLPGGPQRDEEEDSDDNDNDEKLAAEAEAEGEEEALVLPSPLKVADDLPDTLQGPPPRAAPRRRGRKPKAGSSISSSPDAASSAAPTQQQQEMEAALAAAAAAEGKELLQQVYLELSKHTGWLHVHAAADGSRPLGAHIDPYDVDGLATLCFAVLHKGEGGPGQLEAAKARAATEVVVRGLSPAIVLHPRAKWHVVRAIADLRGLSTIKRGRLYGRCFQPPLDKWFGENPLRGKAGDNCLAPASFRRHVSLEELLDGARHSTLTRKVGGWVWVYV